MWCFEQAKDADLAAKARIHQSSVLFVVSFTYYLSSCVIDVNNNRAVIEMKAAKMMESVSKGGLFFQLLNTCTQPNHIYLLMSANSWKGKLFQRSD